MKYLTIKGKTDGFGAQYQAILSGISYCIYKKYTYVHTPFTKMDHDIELRKANAFIGLHATSGVGDPRCTLLELPFVSEVHYSKTPSIYYTNEVLDSIRKCYYTSEKPNRRSVDIAIHIRRGDVGEKENRKRYTPNSVYQLVIKKLKEKYPDYTITIFSEGTYEDFKDLGLEERCLRLNEDVLETFHSLVSSKVLITGLSSFSYCAGLLNSNTIYHFDSFWHKKLDHWYNLSDLIGAL